MVTSVCRYPGVGPSLTPSGTGPRSPAAPICLDIPPNPNCSLLFLLLHLTYITQTPGNTDEEHDNTISLAHTRRQHYRNKHFGIYGKPAIPKGTAPRGTPSLRRQTQAGSGESKRHVIYVINTSQEEPGLTCGKTGTPKGTLLKNTKGHSDHNQTH